MRKRTEREAEEEQEQGGKQTNAFVYASGSALFVRVVPHSAAARANILERISDGSE